MHKRYTRKDMGKIWEDSSKFKSWLKIEIAVAQARAISGQIPEYVPDLLQKYARVDTRRIEELDKEMDHDMNAFLKTVSESIASGMRTDKLSEETIEEALASLHAGLTSYDIEDTTLALRFKISVGHVLDGIVRLRAVLMEMAEQYKHTPQIGRTHLQHAEPITYGLKILNWYNSFTNHQSYFENNRPQWEVGKISGAVGTYSHLDPEIEDTVGKQLQIYMARVSSQIVSREGVGYLMSGLANMASTLSKCAGDIEHLSSTEVQEVFEAHPPTKTGSSAMPHKSLPEFANANKCERIISLAKVVRANSLVGLENIDIRHEQDLTQSAAERIVIVDSLILVDYMLALFTRVMGELKVDPSRMLDNIWMTGGLIFSQHVTKALMDKGMPREDARVLVIRLCMETAEKDRSQRNFKAAVMYSQEAQKWLTVNEIDECFNLDNHLRNVGKVFERFDNIDL